MTERYFVCDDCAHQWNAPEFPGWCENCQRLPRLITECPDADSQEEHSASVLEWQEAVKRDAAERLRQRLS